jgi:hypothetical protein
MYSALSSSPFRCEGQLTFRQYLRPAAANAKVPIVFNRVSSSENLQPVHIWTQQHTHRGDIDTTEIMLSYPNVVINVFIKNTRPSPQTISSTRKVRKK